MTSRKEYLPVNSGPRAFGTPKPKFTNRFYEPILLLAALNLASPDHQTPKAPDLSQGVAQSPELDFHCFLNKLALLCDSDRCGNTVTAVVVLQYPDRIQYRFASNQRKEADLIHTQSFLENILNTLGTTDVSDLTLLRSHILRGVISFTQPRIRSYAKSLMEQLPLCISDCQRDDSQESRSILTRLEELRELVSFSTDKNLDDKAFSTGCESLISAIDLLHQSEVESLIRDKSKNGRMNQSLCWSEFRHASGRLLSYLHAVRCLISTRKRLPELFEDFEVRYIASSIPEPLRERIKDESLSMSDIINHMTSDPTKQATYRAHAEFLEKFEVDKAIQHLAKNKNFRPIVHAEIVVLDSISRDGVMSPSKFFGGYKYIGCSKPSCRLCSYYFAFHPSAVESRPTHRNLYHNWRMPVFSASEGPEPGSERETLMNKILEQVRRDAFQTLREKVPERKEHDSNTEPTYPIDGISTREHDVTRHRTTSFKFLDIGRSRNSTSHTFRSTTLSEAVSIAENVSESEDEDEDSVGGGVEL
ncbi:hypothetical protein BKA65DRAFT_511911 [Rhexocercosporidium sp. MPI-PUGE-AT-0058]|nr:hypothetical protein BKA65DRAFT_511911 [Rhexocercosporidium sp. MPI-PUGE-AT-0058]